MKAIELCVNRFDVDTRAGFLDLYTKIDADVDQGITTQNEFHDGDAVESESVID
jgi:hypothetical protein